MRLRVMLSAIAFTAAGLVPQAATARDFLSVIKVTADSDLDFGKLALSGLGGHVRLKPSGERFLSGEVDNLGGAYGPATAGVKGRPHGRFVIYAPHISRLRRSGGGRLIAKRIRSKPFRFGQFDEKGEARIQFGADLPLSAQAEQGQYRGRVSFWVIYL